MGSEGFGAMNRGQILEKIIKRAIERGFSGVFPFISNESAANSNVHFRLIFDQDFAKAFFGDEAVDNDHGGQYPMWQAALKQAVTSRDPLLYYAEFLESIN